MRHATTSAAASVALAVGAISLAAAFVLKSFPLLLFAIISLCVASANLVERGGTMLLIVASTTFTLLLAELAIPLLPRGGEQGTYFDPESDYTTVYSEYTDLGLQPTEGVHTSRKFTADDDLIYDVTYRIGPDGFRLPDAGDGERRVNFLGCSFTFGEGLEDDETLPYLMGEEMPAVAFKNFGSHGWGVHQALAILQSDRDTSGTINFLLTAPWHAERSACVPTWTYGSPRYLIGADGSVALAGTCGSLPPNVGPIGAGVLRVLGRSALYRAVRQTLAERADQDRQIADYLALVRAVADISEARGQTLIIGFIRAREKFFRGSYNNALVFRELTSIADEVVDLTLASRVEELDREYYIHALDRHPTALANRKRAVILAEVLPRHLAAP